MTAFDLLDKRLYISGFADEISSSFEEQLDVSNELGISYISLRGIEDKMIGDYSLNEIQRHIQPKVEHAKIRVSSLGSPIGKIQLHDEEAFQKQLIMLSTLCEIATALSCNYIRIFSFYLEEGSDFDSVGKEVVCKLKKFVDIAKTYNVILVHENEKDIFGDCLKRCNYLFEEIKSDHFKAIFDFANFVQCGEDPKICYEQLKEYIVYFHIKDARYADEQNVVCGTGDGKIKEILSLAIKDGYEGFLTLEPHLVLFDALKNLEQKEANQVIKDNKGINGKQGYNMQYEALLAILQQIGE